MSSTNHRTILEIIAPLKSAAPAYLYERISRDLVSRDNRLNSEIDQLTNKLNQVSMTKQMLEKNQKMMSDDYGLLYVDYATLKAKFERCIEECQGLKNEKEAQVRDLKEEVSILQEEYKTLSERHVILEKNVKDLEKEVGVLREENAELKGKCEEAEKRNKIMDLKYRTLEMRHEAVVNVMGPQREEFGKHLAEVERKMACLEAARASASAGTPGFKTNGLNEILVHYGRDGAISEQVIHSHQSANASAYPISDSVEENNIKGLKRKQVLPEASNHQEHGSCSSKRMLQGPASNSEV